jgi:predicted ATPase/class 3 adenylate cyclase
VTFVFTDIEGSTRLWDTAPQAMRVALETHDEVLRAAIEKRGGFVFSTGGDGFAAAFSRAGDAAQAAVDAQSALTSLTWPKGAELRVRMGVHTGEVDERDGDYFGAEVNRAARLMAIAHGGQVLCSDVTASLVGDHAALVDLGEHRLRDLSTPLGVFQVGIEPFPPVRALDSFPTNLPAQSSAFVGREAQLAEVAAALKASRVVTLTGVGGVGKTRLAVQAAAELLPDFRDGAWLVELAPAVEPSAVVEVVASALGVPERQGQSLSASVADFLHNKESLIVLDNCEHLIDTVAALVEQAIARSAHVSVLATSREGLGVHGERILVVPSLSVPADDAVDVVADAGAVQLFVERAQEAKTGFALTDANAAALAQLVRRLDGIPLAIELAAARVRSLTPAELAERLDERFRLLAGGRRTAVERHQTLRRAIDWSYEQLAESEKLALNRTAVFATDFSLGAAEAVISGSGIEEFEVADLLGRLVDKSLISAEDTDGATRFRLLETIRQYAQERLEETGEAEAFRLRHAEHYGAFAASAGIGLRGSDEAAWTGRVEVELDHLRAALAWAVAGGKYELALRIVAPLVLPGTSVGYATGSWAATVVAMPEARTHSLYPQVLAWEAWAESVAGEVDKAIQTAQEALHAAASLGVDERTLCRVLTCCSPIALYSGDFEEASRRAARWVDAARAVDDAFELAQALTFSYAPASALGDLPAALALTEEGVIVAERLGNPSTICFANMTAGLVRIDVDPERAPGLYERALGAADSVGNQLGISMCLSGQAIMYAQQGDWRKAAPFAARCIQSFYRAGDQQNFRTQLAVAAIVLTALHDDDAAAILYGTSVIATRHNTGMLFGAVELIVGSEASLRERLGEQRFEECVRAGAAMSPDEIAALVAEHLDAVSS